jgi:hypothetical protein
MQMKPEEFIADLHQLKMRLLRPIVDGRPETYVEPNISYVVIETLIATFMDKYKIHSRDVEAVLLDRQFESERNN